MEDPDDAQLTMGKGLLDVFLKSLRQMIGVDKVDTLVQVRPNPNLPPGARVPPPEELAKAIEADADLDEQIARPGHIRNLATAPAKGLKAPEPPQNARVGVRFSKEMERLQLEEPDTLQAHLDEISSALTKLESTMNPFVAKGRQYMLNAHHTGMFVIASHIPREQHFDTENIIQYGVNTLVLRITQSRSSEGGPIRSSTAVQWMTQHTYNICTYTRDPQTGNRTGLTVLRQGFLKRMEDAVRWCVWTYSLVRHAKIQRSLDRTAVQLIMELLIHRTRFHGRAGAIQTMLAMSLAMFGGLRSGTLQANHKEYRDKEMYLKWGDITLTVVAVMRWSATINFDHWKGFSDMEGHRKIFTFGPVTKAHNLIFEPAMLLLLDGMGRGVFENISNPKELIAYKGAVIKIKLEFMKTPVFVRRSVRGLQLIEHEPAPPHQITGIMKDTCRQAGMEGGGVHALRRGAGRRYILSIGRDNTQYMLNHTRPGAVMDNHYTVGLKDLDLVGIYLEEGDTTSHLSYNQKKALEKAKLATQGMSVLVCRVQTTNPTLHTILNEDPEQKKTRQEEEEKALEGIPLIRSLREAAESSWNAFTDLVPETHVSFDHLRVVKKIPKLMEKVPDEKQMLAGARADTFRSANSRLGEARRQALKIMRRKAQDLKIKDIPDATFQERDAAAKMIDEESLIIAQVKAWKIQQRETNEYLSSKENPVRLEISEDQAVTLGISETVRQELADLPESKDDDSGDEEESDSEVTEDHEPLQPTNTLSPVPEKTTSDKPSISSIDINLERPLKFDLDADLEEPERVLDEPFDDSDEPDVLPIDTDVSRGEIIEYYWEALEEQREKSKRGKGKGKAKDTSEFIPTLCNLCKTMPWRAQTLFNTLSNLERHKRQEHDEWGNLELQMVTDDPKLFKCPGCDKRFNKIGLCKTHCWKYCSEKERFQPLKDAHDQKRPGQDKDTAKRQDDRQEEGEIGIEIQGPDYGPKMARAIHTEFTQEPGVLQSWADRSGGVTRVNTDGVSVEDIQKSFGRVAGLTGGQPYNPPIPPADDLDDIPELTTSDNVITTLGPNFMTSRRDRLLSVMKRQMEMYASDYEETDEEEQD